MSEEMVGTLSIVHQDEKNSRKHSPYNISQIENSIDTVGIGRSGVCNKSGKLLAGNGTFEALQVKAAHGDDIIVRRIKAKWNEWIVVERYDLNEKQEVQMSIADNRATDTSSFDNRILRDLDEEFEGILKSSFSTKELDKILGKVPALTLPSSDKNKLGVCKKCICRECGQNFTS